MAQTTTVAAGGGPDIGGALVASVPFGSPPVDALKLLVGGWQREDETGSGGGTHLWPVEEPTLGQWRRLATFG